MTLTTKCLNAGTLLSVCINGYTLLMTCLYVSECVFVVYSQIVLMALFAALVGVIFFQLDNSFVGVQDRLVYCFLCKFTYSFEDVMDEMCVTV